MRKNDWSCRAEAKLMQEEGLANARITELRKELVVAQYQVSMGEEKVHPILKAQKVKTLQLVANAIDKAWKTWSALLRIKHNLLISI